MQTPIIILSLLFIPTILAAIYGRITNQSGTYRSGGLVGISLAFMFFSLGHFVLTDAMVEMLPEFIPERRLLVYATGIIEASVSIGLLVPSLRKATGILCIILLISFFPANIYAAFNQLGPGGHQWGSVYLFIRAPLQIFLIFWCYWFTIRSYSK